MGLQGSGEGARAVLTGEVEDVACGLIISSIGYKSVSIDPAVPFDKRKAVVPNKMGRVQEAAGTEKHSFPPLTIKAHHINLGKHVFPGLYCSGWVKTGPTGVIATTMNNSFDTARSLMDDMDSGTLDVSAVKPGAQTIKGLLETRGTFYGSPTTSISQQWAAF